MSVASDRIPYVDDVPSPFRGSGAPRRFARRFGRPGLPLVVAAFVLSRIGFVLAGVRFDDSAIRPNGPGQVQWQLLSTHLLKHDLLRSVWYLHSQPPLYNLFAGFLLHLPAATRQTVAAASFYLLGLAMVVAVYLLLSEFTVSPLVATIACLAVIGDPAYALFESWLSWSYPTAAFLTLGAYGCVRLLRSVTAGWSAFTFGCLVIVVLLDSTFQWPWFLVAGVLLALSLRRHWRPVLLGAAIPSVVLLTWSVKDAVLFGTNATSSWFGMNLAHITLSQAPPSQLANLVDGGTLKQIADAPSFASVSQYNQLLGPRHHTGVPALDQAETEFGLPNFNNSIYLDASNKLLPQALRYIWAEPGTYAGALHRAVALWLIPADEFTFLSPNHARVSGYARAFDAAVLVQPSTPGLHVGSSAEVARVLPPLQFGSVTVLFLILIALMGGPVAAYRARHRPHGLVCLLLWFTVVYSLAVTSMADIGENMRFRFELGPLPLLLAILTVKLVMPKRATAQPVETDKTGIFGATGA